MAQPSAEIQKETHHFLQHIKFTRIFLRNPRLALEYPLLLAAAIGELLPFVILFINLSTYVDDKAFPPYTRSNVVCAAQLVILQFGIDREQLARSLGAPRPHQAIQYFVNYVGNIVYNRAHSDFACGSSAGAYKELSFVFQAYGGDCSTTAQRDTIKGGIENHLQTVDYGEICATECLKLGHGGSWAGYLLVGPAKSFDSSKYCGPDLDFSGCSSGEAKDFN